MTDSIKGFYHEFNREFCHKDFFTIKDFREKVIDWLTNSGALTRLIDAERCKEADACINTDWEEYALEDDSKLNEGAKRIKRALLKIVDAEKVKVLEGVIENLSCIPTGVNAMVFVSDIQAKIDKIKGESCHN